MVEATSVVFVVSSDSCLLMGTRVRRIASEMVEDIILVVDGPSELAQFQLGGSLLTSSCRHGPWYCAEVNQEIPQ